MMRAVVIGEDGRPATRRIPAPEPGPGELLVRVRAVGLCGSDVEKLDDPSSAGAVLGHEIVGVVEAGPLPIGTRVTVAHRVPCDACERCRTGHETTCAAYLSSGLRPGGLAELLVASVEHLASGVQVVPDHVSDLAATVVEPLACVLRGISLLPRGRGAVVGCGFVGQLAVRALAERGDTPFAVEQDGARLARALEACERVADAGDELDYAVVTAPGALNDALDLVRPGGTVLVFAAPSGTMPIALDTIYRRELRLVGSRSAGPAALREALAMIAGGRLVVDDLVTDALPLSEITEGVERYRTRRALKVAFTP